MVFEGHRGPLAGLKDAEPTPAPTAARDSEAIHVEAAEEGCGERDRAEEGSSDSLRDDNKASDSVPEYQAKAVNKRVFQNAGLQTEGGQLNEPRDAIPKDLQPPGTFRKKALQKPLCILRKAECGNLLNKPDRPSNKTQSYNI